MKKKEYLNNRGVTTADIIIAVIIIVLFVSVIMSSFYNYYISIQSRNRTAIATNTIIDVIENIELMEYDEVNEESVNSILNTLQEEKVIPNGYIVLASLQNYNEIQGNEGKEDVIKILKVTAQYSLGNKVESFEITRLITK